MCEPPVGISVLCMALNKTTGSISYSLTQFTLAAGDETLQFVQQLSSSARSEVDDWSLMLTSDKPQPSTEFPGISNSLELHWRCWHTQRIDFIFACKQPYRII